MQLSQWLRLVGFWGTGSHIFPSHVTRWTGNGVLCRVYLCASLGVLEPLFLTTVVLLCRGPLKSGAERGLWPNAWVVACAVFACTPVLVAQAVLAWLGDFFPRRQWELHSHAAARYFLSPYILVPAAQCGALQAPPDQRCALCAFPAGACLVELAFGLLWGWAMWHETQRLWHAVINIRLQRRVRLFQVSSIAGVLLSNVLRAATLSGSPLTWQFQILWFLHFLTLPALLTLMISLLVLAPTHEAYAALKALPELAQPAKTDDAKENATKLAT